MITMNTGKKACRLELGEAGGKSLGSRTLHLVHANDQENGDDFEGRRNWTFMLVLFASVVAGLSSSAAVWSLF
ncbi:hypothetical protein [Neorhizobium sp. DT-125]|uniref:hypothetical protein n=1 Tax=Neorhizobium sp. DT-125 TaxID=3396163 RepID=UPI003F1CE5AC